MTGRAIVLRGDARSLPLPDSSVDLIITSPPYWALRSYTDAGQHYDGQVGTEPTPSQYIENLVVCTREWARVLRPTGSLFVNLGDKYSTGNSGLAALGERYAGGGHSDALAKRASGRVQGVPPKCLLLLPERYRIACVDRLGLIARSVIIWSKVNGMPENVTDRVRRSHEDWLHLVKQPRYFAALDEIRQPHSAHTLRYYGREAGAHQRPANAAGNAVNGTKHRLTTVGDVGALPSSVWEMATQPLRVPAELGVEHFAAFPPEWPRRLILGWSPPGGVILDPCGGTGTTAMVARALGRTGISVDLSTDYCRIARWRTNDRAQIAKVLGKPAPPPEPAGMDGLFDREAVTP